MSEDIVRKIRSLLGLLEAEGEREVAAGFRAEFDLRGWGRLTPDDLGRVARAYARPQSADPEPGRGAADDHRPAPFSVEGACRSEREESGGSAEAEDGADTTREFTAPTASPVAERQAVPPPMSSWRADSAWRILDPNEAKREGSRGEGSDERPWSLEEDWGVWVEGLGVDESIIRSTEELLRARSVDELESTVVRLVVERLGFEAVSIDLRDRVLTPSAWNLVKLVARHEEMAVLVVEVPGPRGLSTTLGKLTRNYPYAVVFVRDALTGRTWFGTPSGARPFLRALGGSRPAAEAGSDLLTWCRRLAALMPRFEESTQQLQRRVQGACEVPPEAWAAEATEGRAILLAEGPRRERRALLQEGVDAPLRRLWGLQGVFEQSFPCWMHKADGWLHCRAYRLLEQDAEEVLEMRLTSESTYGARIDFELEYRPNLGPPVRHVLRALVPLWTDRGKLVVDGDALCLRPLVDPNGRLVRVFPPGAESGDDDGESIETVGDEEFSGESDEEVEVPQSSAEASAEGEEESDESGDETAGLAIGASLQRLMSLAVRRKLRLVRNIMAALPHEHLVDSEQVRFAFRNITDSDGCLRLWSDRFLRAVLAPWSEGTPSHPTVVAAEPGFAGVLPPWACPDLSACLPPGEFAAVAAAVLHPEGQIAVPIREGTSDRASWRLAEGDAFAVNPRLGGAAGDPRAVWIHPRLESWGHLPVGGIEDPLAIIERGSHVRVEAVVIHGATPRILTSSRALPHASTPRVKVTANVPWAGDEGPPGTFLVSPGESVQPGQAWYAVASRIWTQSPMEYPHEVRVAARILGEELPEPHRVFNLSMAHRGRVAECWTTPVRGRLGVIVSYRLTLVLEGFSAPKPEEACAITRSGKRIPFERQAVEDLPFDAEGHVPAIVVEDPAAPAGSDIHRDGRTGDIVGAHRVLLDLSVVLEARAANGTRPDPHIERRFRDGEFHPRFPGDPALTERHLSWWALREPATASMALEHQLASHGGWAPWQGRLDEALHAAGLPPRSPHPLLPLGRRPLPTEPKFDLWLQGNDSVKADTPIGDAPVGFAWSCPCGELKGGRRAGEDCAACGDPVGLMPAENAGVQHHVPLWRPMLHPWFVGELAGVLGLNRKEFDQWRRTATPPDVVTIARLAGGTPREHLLERARRAARPADAKRYQAQADALPAFLNSENFETLFLERLPVLPNSLRGDGLVAGADRIRISSFTRRVRILQLGSEAQRATRDEALEFLVADVDQELQREVDGWFGVAEDAPAVREPGSIAELIRRLVPTSRQGDLELTLDGLHWIPALRSADGSLAGAALAVEADSCSVRVPCWPAATRARSGAITWWTRRAAVDWMAEHWLPPMALWMEQASCVGAATGTGSSDPSHETHAALLRRVRALACALESASADPSMLFELAHARAALRLPADDRERRERLGAWVACAFPGEDEDLRAGRGALVDLLAGIRRGVYDTWYFPHTGWTRPGPLEPSRYALPSWKDPAWNVVPAFALTRGPARLLAHVALGLDAPVGPLTLLLTRARPLEPEVMTALSGLAGAGGHEGTYCETAPSPATALGDCPQGRPEADLLTEEAATGGAATFDMTPSPPEASRDDPAPPPDEAPSSPPTVASPDEDVRVLTRSADSWIRRNARD